jgi:phospholipid/cholesterol/gamma-HCH transport system substrate-binding protein
VSARLRLLGVVLAVAAVTATACGSNGYAGIYDLPLPGGADLGDHPYQVTAQFADVLDLVPQAAVKVNDVAVGRVSAITLPPGKWTANVTLQLNGSVSLPANAIAYLRQSSLLGEKYVELDAPVDGTASGKLAPGAVIPLGRTSRSPQVEEVLGALSLLLNGGGIDQIKTISTQLNQALSGNEPEIRSVLSTVDSLLSDLDAHKQDIVNALDGLDRLSATLAGRDQQIGAVLDDLTPGLSVLDQERGELVSMLNALDSLSGVAVHTINASQADLVADLQALSPTLRQLANAGQALPQSLQVLATYPFTDAVLPAVKGDYLNVYLSLNALPGTTLIPPVSPPNGTGGGSPADLAKGAGPQRPGSPSSSSAPGSTSSSPPDTSLLPLPPTTDIAETPTTGATSTSAPPSSSSAPPSSSSAPPRTSTTGSVPPSKGGN